MYAEATGAAVVEDFPERALEYLGISWRVEGRPSSTIPAEGPLVVVANHPFGAADGLILLSLIRQVRPDVKLLGNYLLGRMPELRPILLEVDPFAGDGSRAMNARMVRRAIDWTRRGGAVIVFPAGEVASVAAPDGRLIDGPWRHGVARILLQSEAPLLPVCFEGRNSRLFELAGRVHPALRTALLPRELLRQRGRSMAVTLGDVVPSGRIVQLGNPASVVSYLRAKTYALRGGAPILPNRRPVPPQAEVATPEDPRVIAAEVAALSPSRRLLDQRAWQVIYASASEAPALVREIGRLREATFRAAGEGTGRSRDLDRFDLHYWHLFVWHRESQEVVGAYRLAAMDRTVQTLGLRGLYTQTLFRYGRALLDELGPTLELGRSFVRREYQRDYSALMLLWQGIGRFVVRHPQYRKLIGPVSISADYHPVSRDVLVNALEQEPLLSPLSAMVRSKHPYRRHATPQSGLDATAAGVLLKEIEPDGKALPVLLRQYLKLNARVLGTSVDPDFSNVVDALMVVDLDAVAPAQLNRYLGVEGAAAFRHS
jgi:putative hemolysin